MENSTAKEVKMDIDIEVLKEMDGEKKADATAHHQAFLDTLMADFSEMDIEVDEEKKADATAHQQPFLDTLMADFPGEEKCNALLGGMSVKNFSMSATSLLKYHYKVEDKDIIFTTAFGM